jgi:hypothetical protein
MKQIFLLTGLLFLLQHSPAFAQVNGSLSWKFRFHPGDSVQVIEKATTGSNGSFLVTGSTVSSNKKKYLLVSKYDPSGKLLWATSDFLAPGSDVSVRGTDIAEDAAGNIYAAVAVESTDGSLGKYWFVVKYDAGGFYQWQASFIPEGYGLPSAIAIDGNGDVLVTGYFDLNGKKRASLAKVSSQGQILFVKKEISTTNDIGMRVFSDPSGNYYVFSRKDVTCGWCEKSRMDKYDPNGNLITSKDLGLLALTQLKDVEMAPNSDFYVGATGNEGGGNYLNNFLILKLSPSGTILDSVTHNSPYNHDDQTVDIGLSGNRILITGRSSRGNNLESDIQTACFDTSSFNLLWAKRLPADAISKNLSPAYLGPDGSGFYLSGTSTTASSASLFIFKCDNQGDTLWSRQFNTGLFPGAKFHCLAAGSGAVSFVASGNSAASPDTGVYIHSYTPAGDTAYSIRHKSQAMGSTSFKKAVTDAHDNLYIISSTGLESDTSEYRLIKLNRKGKKIWEKRYPGDPVDIAITGSQKIFVLVNNFSSAPDQFITLEKYDTTGVCLFRKYVEMRDAAATSMAIAPDSSVYISGIEFGSGYIAKYTANGDKVWVKYLNNITHGCDNFAGIYRVICNRGAIYTAGSCLSKLDTSGNIIWAKTVWPGIEYFDRGILSTDSAGNLFTAAAINYETVVYKYDTAGTRLYKTVYSPSDEDTPFQILTDAGGNSYVTGRSRNVAASLNRVFLNKYSPSGALVWSRNYYTNNNFGSDAGVDLKFDQKGDIWLTGDIAGDSLVTVWLGQWHPMDIFAARYDTAGNLQWQAKYKGRRGSEDKALQIIVNKKDVAVLGSSVGPYYLNEGILIYFENVASYDPVLSVAAAKEEGFTKVYPNPSGSAVHIERSSSAPACLEIWDLTGRIVKRYTAVHSHLLIPKGELKPGVYIYRIGLNEGTGKIVITE